MGAQNSIWYNLTNLLNFRGRQTRSQFWPYIAFVEIILVIGMMLFVLPSMMESLEKMMRFTAEHPEQTAVSQGAGGFSIRVQGSHPDLLPNMPRMILIGEISRATQIFLFAAAIFRRLHDCGKSGLWGLAPLPFAIFAAVVVPGFYVQFQSGTVDVRLMQVVMLNSLLFWATLIYLIVLLCRPTNNGENRYGSEVSAKA